MNNYFAYYEDESLSISQSCCLEEEEEEQEDDGEFIDLIVNKKNEFIALENNKSHDSINSNSLSIENPELSDQPKIMESR